MKLVSLYIENFGGLSQYSLEFADGLTVINEPNGFGKTTLAEFIRAMFYGFPRKAKTLDKSLRQKYTPWNGGKCGGNLTFRLEGKQYRIERTFGTTPRGDSFNLIDLETNKKSTRFSEEIGVEIFGLDSDSFERSTYMPQLHEAFSFTTGSIQAKLSNLVEDTNDINNFTKAVTTLKAKRSGFTPYRGAGGAVAQAQSAISRLQGELDDCREQGEVLSLRETELENWERQLNGDQKELEETRQKIVAASAAAAAAAARDQYRRMEELHNQLSSKKAQLEPMLMESELLDDLAEQNRELMRTRHELELLETTDEGKLKELEVVFSSGVPTDEELSSGRKHLARIRELEQERLLLSAAIPEEKEVKKQSPLNAILLLIPGIGGIAGGIVLLVQRMFWPGGIALGLGIGALLASIFLFVRLMVSQALAASRQNRPERLRINVIDQEILSLRQLVRELVRHYTGKENLTDALEELSRNAEAYRKLRMEQAQRRERATQLHDQILRLTENMNRHLGIGDAEQSILRRRLAKEQHREICDRLMLLEQEMKDFHNSHIAELSAPETGDGSDLNLLRQREMQLTMQITNLTRKTLSHRQLIQSLEKKLEQIPQLQEELEQWQTRKQEGQKNTRLLDDTVAFLEQAKENLQTSYLGPIRQQFDRYMELLMNEGSEKILVSSDLEVSLERYGQSRELGYFSAGQIDVVMLCMRLALVDALFRDVKPFVILDDPFVNLDDARTARALELLQTLAKEKQIVYLVCHSSRSI